VLLIDDLLAAPFRGLMFVLSEINKAVEAEQEAEERRIMSDLAGLHRRLDEDQITEAEFEAEEQALLSRLDRLHGEGEVDAGREQKR
jgi:Gas vesicle protein G